LQNPAESSGVRPRAALTAVLALLLAVSWGPRLESQEPAPAKARYARAIAAFLAQDRVAPPPAGGILFVGSSVFREWTMLEEHMAPLPVFNRAFGGSRTDDQLLYVDTIVIPYRPKMIVYYCGSNDINAGFPPAEIAGRTREFIERVHRSLPGTRIFYVSINRAPQKQARWRSVDSTNALMREYCERDPRLVYIDVNPALFDTRGEPRLELYKPDRLHLTPAAYEAFTTMIKPVLAKAWQEVQ